MKRITKILMGSLLVSAVFMLSLLSFAQPPQINPDVLPKPVDPKELKKPVPITDEPWIREFSITPDRVPGGGRVVFRWRVEPGPGGSPITNIRIEGSPAAPETIRTPYSGSELTGERTVTIPPDTHGGLPRYTLTATNQKGRSTSREVRLEIIPDNPVIREFSVNPPSVLAGYGIAVFRWRVEPGPGGSPITNVNLRNAMTRSVIRSFSTQTGEHRVIFPPENPRATYTYDLEVTNMAGRKVGTAPVSVEVIADEPVIHEFSASTNLVHPGETFYIRYRVWHHPGGSIVTNVTIEEEIGRSRSRIYSGGALLSGEPGMPVTIPRIRPYTESIGIGYWLTATNRAGRSATRKIIVGTIYTR